jgi:iron(III) transport system substrate-binding protein
VDQAYGQKVLDRFTRDTGVRLAPLFDIEASKTTGLVQLIRLEGDRPRAHVFWSSELFGTILLARQGELAQYRPKTADDIPSAFRDSDGRWTAIAARARVIAFNSDLLEREEAPKTLWDLTDSKWKGKLVVADPRFGTTRGHLGALYAVWGKERLREFLERLNENDVHVVDGNSTAVRLVGRGEAAICLTDTDDVWAAQRNKKKVDLVYPDADTHGTLVIPNSVALIKSADGNDAATRLVDFLVSSECEKLLAESDSHNVPVRPSLASEYDRYRVPRILSVDYEKIADSIEPALEVWEQAMDG